MKIVVLGIGNLLVSDEGFGVQIVKIMHQHFVFPSRVSIVDGGTLGWELLPVMEEADAIIIVDAVSGGKEPGTVYQFTGENVQAYFKQKISAHEAGIQEVLAYLTMKGKTFQHIAVIGVEPRSFEPGLNLSPEVKETVPGVIHTILQMLQTWGVPIPEAPPINQKLDHYLREMHP